MKYIIRSQYISIILLVLVCIVLGSLWFMLQYDEDDDGGDSSGSFDEIDELYRCPACPSSRSTYLGNLCSSSKFNDYHQSAISTDSNICAESGKSILEEGGNAIDATVAVLLCMGVTIPESLGLGGGSLIVLYLAKSNRSVFVDAREMAPKNVFRDMFNTSKIEDASQLGLQSIAVPGELAGYWHLHSNYGSGRITWKRLFRDSIDYAENGFEVGFHLQNSLRSNRAKIMKFKHLKQVFFNEKTKNLYQKGEILRQPKLAETLRNLSESLDPNQYFYQELAEKIIADIYDRDRSDFPEQQPIITVEDFHNYRLQERSALSARIKDDMFLHTTHLPGSGLLFSFIMKIMLHEKFREMYRTASIDPESSILFYHRLTEAFKFAYAKRSDLGDDRFDPINSTIDDLTSEEFLERIVSKINDSTTYDSDYYEVNGYQPPDHGTAHVSIVDSEGNAVAATSTINLYFGSKVISPSTGIILNDEMDDFNSGKVNYFGLKPSNQNTIQPWKRPLSSMCPSIFTDNTGVRLVIGGSGGSKITTSIALVSLRHLFLNETIKQAIDASRIHHQLFPSNIEYEPCFRLDILDGLRLRNHQVKEIKKGVRGAVVMAISRDQNGLLQANSDFRKGGTIAGF
ncbi:Glutathione hydrolase 1 proenzyme [Sarcoptes scabiei]|uniref:Gamma-glutamyltranspeptidase 1 n=1 Tax=Sarcoptes scabiei TaxID=52283 RepID=A0A834R944_SARSC|nr:Glutathione hydrolase 1 proenzyme [Sarcoptes scabiei]KAI7685489.1 Glutathione hydrolase 1 proenzyme [Sarcoptes scabiei]UXI22932.1 hypothetical protein NH340_JMT08875 [Sarcoptes scabiei]